MSGVYVQVKPGRAGLGNMLFPWARAVIFAQRHDARVLRVPWTQLKIGPLLRGERDKRYYTGLFSSQGHIRGPHKWALLATCPKVSEYDAPGVEAVLQRGRGIVVFEGMRDLYQPLLGHQALIRQRLNDMLAAPMRRRLESQALGDFMAMHVRRGDKVILAYGQEYQLGKSGFTPAIEWYVKITRQLLEWTAGKLPLVIFSDGTEDQLAPLLHIPGVRRAPDNPSIVDILLLAASRLLVTMHDSTFSLWASYLGQMPTVFYGDQIRRLHEDDKAIIRSDLWGNLPPDALPLIASLTAPAR